ncbi:MAG: hypothetical protein PHQ58_07230 [Rhodoferax sp.]|uniref:hypothetical protein n=1 Tax=Rhodoferax sp. TaxID=50421 RepID=UPI00261B91D4|nr:hypothetical protein [Rhodoferax sp.]MDD2880213.1 hypothetical protein [Rhodoferax sp.]
MDELAYQASRQGANPSPCVFEKALLASCAQCSLSKRLSLAEREVVACTFEVARINCGTLESLFRERATFALRLPRPGIPIVHVKAMQLQCGGLRGLQAALAAPALDVHDLVQRAQANQSSLLDLPWQDIVNSIAAWKLRRRAAPKTPS